MTTPISDEVEITLLMRYLHLKVGIFAVQRTNSRAISLFGLRSGNPV